MGKLDGRIAAVTGAATGLGRAIALLYAAEGADVAVLDRNGEGAEVVAARIRALGRRSLAVTVDVGDETGVTQAFARIEAELGPLDILVNNAGIVTVSLLETMPTQTFDEMIRIDLKSVFLCTRAVLPGMRARGYGRIVNISSQLAYKGGEGMAHYAAAKAGVVGLTRSLAYEVTRHGIAVNAICPGPLDTDMKLPPEWVGKKESELVIGRQGRVEEVAPTALLLAGEDAAFYVGATFHPNGGDIMV
ncbi:SDR family NAD(P)-dependent oxidoreductase [Antarcticirhabdus aurantiaca]|uniref:SDR family NAD(P)-dependent oxidoreductase n=1 Tax=Antarcticirhabdus aurantiaca TaxID=2606717 RepID=A0ACD4NN62_9HYPH|nr:SDR family NAD(P)-dependent oxidoreductase [Antarcticirhabdus aurantiaca]WAJ28187.1 SDR family NAD(P)-dependent oxidoreductase [Jeongeuplla avenae]